MTPTLPWLFAALVALAAALALLAVWSRRRLAVRIGAVALMAVVASVAYLALVDLLSRPKPAGLAFAERGVARAEVLAAALREGRGIYLWLKLPGVAEPRYYVMPWRQEVAEALQEAMREAERNGAGLAVERPFEDTLENRRAQRFHALPQPKLPDKPRGTYQEYHRPSLPI